MHRKVQFFLPPFFDNIDSEYQTVFVFFFLQSLTTMLIKISILLLYKRTFTIKSMFYAIYAVGAVVIGNALSNIFTFAFQCTPSARFWDPGLRGHCVNRTVLIVLASMFPMLTDFAIYVMPMPVIWGLQMTVRRKLQLTLVFALGGLYLLLSLRLDIWLRIS